MLADPLPKEVQALLRTCVESFEHLAVLLLVYREPTRDWSLMELAQGLNVPEQLVESAVADLRRGGILQITPEADPVRYGYRADTGAQGTIAKLAHEYAENPARVVRLLNANAIERVRTSALQTFADAFVLKKKDQDRG